MNKLARLAWIASIAAILSAGNAVSASDLFKKRHGCEPENCQSCGDARICQQVPTTKKVTHVVYECKVEWYCLTKCPLHIGRRICSSGQICTGCDKPRSRRILVKKFITVEEPTTKCSVETVPAAR